MMAALKIGCESSAFFQEKELQQHLFPADLAAMFRRSSALLRAAQFGLRQLNTTSRVVAPEVAQPDAYRNAARSLGFQLKRSFAAEPAAAPAASTGYITQVRACPGQHSLLQWPWRSYQKLHA